MKRSMNACREAGLVAFSCKGRGWCPSCTNRRAVETGAALEATLPFVRHRQAKPRPELPPTRAPGHGDGASDPYRREHPPVRLPCQVEPQTIEALRLTATGNTPESSLTLVFHFQDLERLQLVDAPTGEALIRRGDRLGGLFDTEGNLV